MTTDIIGAGTDAKVFIQLHVTEPSEFSTDRLWLEDRPEYFERGQVDEFNLQLPNTIGSNVTALTVGHDNNNPYPEWHLDHIELSSEELGKCKVPLLSDLISCLLRYGLYFLLW